MNPRYFMFSISFVNISGLQHVPKKAEKIRFYKSVMLQRLLTTLKTLKRHSSYEDTR